MAERVEGFSHELKRQVRREQRGLCDYCGRACDGNHVELQIHHKIPKSLAPHYNLKPEDYNGRRNAVGLCGPHGCHEKFDKIALEQGIFYDEVIEQEGKPKPLTRRRAG